MTTHPAYEILILGGGPGGCTAALELAKRIRAENITSPPSILLVDKASFPRDKVCGDALSGKVMRTLERTAPELLERVQASAAEEPSWGVTFVAPSGRSLKVPFSRKTGIGAAPGSIMPRMDFDALLFDAVKQCDLVAVRENCNISSFEKFPDGIRCITSNGDYIDAKLVIAADGANSRFARHYANLPMDPRHHCAGVRAYYSGVEGLDEQGFIELHFLKELLPGYFWIFPLPGGRANVGLGMRSDMLRKRPMDLKKTLQELVAAHPRLKDRFANATLDGGVQGLGLPLGSERKQLSGDNYMLVGDAGHLIDPFTGEGISHAMISGVKAAEVALNAFAKKQFDHNALRPYHDMVWKRLGKELAISTRLQQLAQRPWLFNLVVNKAVRNPALADTISCMFNDLDMRERLKKPGFYVDLLRGK